MHAVDGLRRASEPFQCLQHESVAAERHDDIGCFSRNDRHRRAASLPFAARAASVSAATKAILGAPREIASSSFEGRRSGAAAMFITPRSSRGDPVGARRPCPHSHFAAGLTIWRARSCCRGRAGISRQMAVARMTVSRALCASLKSTGAHLAVTRGACAARRRGLRDRGHMDLTTSRDIELLTDAPPGRASSSRSRAISIGRGCRCRSASTM